jgi:hypothetical protein
MERKTINYIRNTTEKILISAAADKLSWSINKLCPVTMQKRPSVYFFYPIIEQLSRKLHLFCQALHKISAIYATEEQLIIPITTTTKQKADNLSFFSINHPVFTLKPINNKHKLLFRRETINKISASPNLIRVNCSLEGQFDCIKRGNSMLFNI